jgi:hypothetical protein
MKNSTRPFLLGLLVGSITVTNPLSSARADVESSHEREAASHAAATIDAAEVSQSPEEMDTDTNTEEKKRFGWGGIPALNYSSDSGLGFGFVANLYRYQDDIEPYKYSLLTQVYLTTKWLHFHKLRLDALQVFDLPLRIYGELIYFSTISNTYCGVGNQVRCGKGEAERQADLWEADLTAAERTDFNREEFIHHYYQKRYIKPEGVLQVRWKFNDLPNKVELLAGWRGSYLRVGDLNERSPYPGSLFAKDHQDGEEGFTSLMQVGLSLDNRDNEPAPTSGYFIEASVRGAHELIGSDWNFGGINFTANGYLSLDRGKRLVLAGRFVFDNAFGEMPTHEIIQVGGSRAYTSYGGEFSGRGVRGERYVGKVKIIGQVEIRYTLSQFELFDQDMEWTGVAFTDAGHIRYEWDYEEDDPTKIVVGYGGGMRLVWNKNFIVRLDVGKASTRNDPLGIYLNVDHVF